ncbi:MAG: hypothetical protein L6R48_23225 [Planctomycetes bacterium]|nr:hypothetical protein [Planctomycetota bacterium]
MQVIYDQLQHLRVSLREFHMLRQSGHIGVRRKRASKRQALRGLPGDWREHLCARAAKGKYADAMLVAALTGCRPEELRRGVLVRKGKDLVNGLSEISFQIEGAKVKLDQGQPRRVITYGGDDAHPLLSTLRARLVDQGELLVRIESPANFTVEVRRLARSLWPKHKLPITAYCLRHQWSADMKRRGDAASVSQGLGHVSAKTRRHYGQANQANSAHALQPIAIEAERPVRPIVERRPGAQATSEVMP